MPTVNGIEIPESGSTREYIADKEGGYMYIVTTNITVNQYRLDEYNEKVDMARATLTKATEELAELEAADPEKK